MADKKGRTKREAGKELLSQIQKDYLSTVINLIPEDKRKEAEAALAGDSLADFIGEHTLLRDDYSRMHDELSAQADGVKADYDRNNDWYQKNLKSLEEGERAKARVAELEAKLSKLDPDDPDFADLATKAGTKAIKAGVPLEEVQQAIREAQSRSEEQGLSLMLTLNDISIRHFKEYGDVLNMEELISHTRKMNEPLLRAGQAPKFGLKDAYQDMTKDMAQAASERRSKEDREKLRAEIRAEVEAEQGHGAYPPPSLEAASTLSGLKPKDGSDYGVAAAVKEFNDLAARRGAS